MALSSRKEISRDYVPSDGVKRLVSDRFFYFVNDTSYHASYVSPVDIRGQSFARDRSVTVVTSMS